MPLSESIRRVESVAFHAERSYLSGVLTVPHRPIGLVVLGRASSSSRFAARNHELARTLCVAHLGLLLLDLLASDEEAEESDGALRRLDVDLLSERLSICTGQLDASSTTRGLPIGYFGSGACGAAALTAAARDPRRVAGIVTQGARVDLVDDATLAAVRAPTLLVVAGRASRMLAAHRVAYRSLTCERRLHVTSASRSLADSYVDAEAATQARRWFARCLDHEPFELAHRRTGS